MQNGGYSLQSTTESIPLSRLVSARASVGLQLVLAFQARWFLFFCSARRAAMDPAALHSEDPRLLGRHSAGGPKVPEKLRPEERPSTVGRSFWPCAHDMCLEHLAPQPLLNRCVKVSVRPTHDRRLQKLGRRKVGLRISESYKDSYIRALSHLTYPESPIPLD